MFQNGRTKLETILFEKAEVWTIDKFLNKIERKIRGQM